VAPSSPRPPSESEREETREEQLAPPGGLAGALTRFRPSQLVPVIPEPYRRALRWDATSGFIGGLFSGSVFPFLGVIARDNLHASTYLLAVLNASPAIGNLFNPLMAHTIRNREKLRYVVLPIAIGRSCLFLMAFAVTAPIFIAIAFVANAITSLASPAYAAVIRDAYPAARRGRYMGFVRVLAVLGVMGGSMAGGALLAHRHFQLVFPLVTIVGVLAVVAFSRIGVPARPSAEAPPVMRLRDTFAIVRSDRSFKLYCTIFYLYGFGNLIAGPVIPVVQVDLLHITPQWVGYLAAASSASSILGYLFWGRVVDRRGPFRLMLMVIAVVSLSPITYFLVFSIPKLPLLLIPACASGFGWAGGDLGYINAAMRFGRRDHAAAYAGMFSFLQAMRGIPGPFLGALLSSLVGPRWVFLVALGFWGASATVLVRSGAVRMQMEEE
jgi:MFS family permease